MKTGKNFLLLISLALSALLLTACSGGSSSSSSSTPAATPQAYPSNLSAVAGDAQVSLSWTAVIGASTYTVYHSTADLTASTNATTLQNVTGISSMTVSTTSADIINLTNSTAYYFKVTAHTATGESVPSTQVTVTTLPAAPTGLVATAGFKQATLSWNAVTSASYKVYYGKQSFANLNTIINYATVGGTMVAVASTAVSHTIKGLDNDIPYYFVVTAVEGDAESAASTEATTTLVAATNLGSISTATRAANISSAGQIDWYQFSASTSANYVALAVGNSTTEIGFYSTEPTDANSCAATTDNGADKKNTYATQDTTANETYYLCVTAPNNTTGSYNLKVMGSVISSTNSSFIYYQNDVVLEKETSLFWQRTHGGKFNWNDASSYCENLTLGSWSNWSLPAREQFEAISQKNADQGDFTNVTERYWSSTGAPQHHANAYFHVAFNHVSTGWALADNDSRYSRCVIQ